VPEALNGDWLVSSRAKFKDKLGRCEGRRPAREGTVHCHSFIDEDETGR